MTIAEMAVEAKVCQRYIYAARRVHDRCGEETLRRVIDGETSLASVDKRYRTPRKYGNEGNTEQTVAAEGLEVRQSDCNNVGSVALLDHTQEAVTLAGPNTTALVLELRRQINLLRRENESLKEHNRLLTSKVERLRGPRRSPGSVAPRRSKLHASLAPEHRSGCADHESGSLSDAGSVDGQMPPME